MTMTCWSCDSPLCTGLALLCILLTAPPREGGGGGAAAELEAGGGRAQNEPPQKKNYRMELITYKKARPTELAVVFS